MEKIIHNIENVLYEHIDLRDKIYIADSFVKPSQKIGLGNGEAKLYLGNESELLRDFYGNNGFKLKCFFKKKELIKFLEDLQPEYKNPQQQYRRKENLPMLFNERLDLINDQDDLIWFEIEEQDQINPPRIYVNSKDPGYELLRELPLPELSYLSILKLRSSEGNIIFHARLFTDYSPLGNRHHPGINPKINLNHNKNSTLIARAGQADFRKRVLNSCPFCPITNIADDRILESAHLKPYKDSNEDEIYNTFNGLPMTPTMHHLYDLGFIGFNRNSNLLISDWISKVTVMKLRLKKEISVPIPDFNKRYEYIEFHEKNIFKF